MGLNQSHNMEVRNVKFNFSEIKETHYVGNTPSDSCALVARGGCA